jgi:DNA polymerase-3 subunit delta
VLVLVSGEGTTGKPILDAIKQSGTVHDADPPRQARARTQWFGERIADSGLRVAADAVRQLEAHLGEDVARLSSTLATLAAAYGEGASIGIEDLSPFLGEAGGEAPWELTDAIDRGDVAASLSHLRRLLGGGDRHPLVVLSSLHRHFEAMLRLDGANVDEHGAAALLGVKSDYTAKKALSQVRRLGSAPTQRAVALIAQADLDLRGANEWPDELVLEVLVARLARLRGRRG